MHPRTPCGQTPWLPVPCFSSASMSLATVGSACSGRVGCSVSSACPGSPVMERWGEGAWKFLPEGIPASFLSCPRAESSCCFGTATTNTSAHACPILENFSLILSSFYCKSRRQGLSRLLRCKDLLGHAPCPRGASCPERGDPSGQNPFPASPPMAPRLPPLITQSP